MAPPGCRPLGSHLVTPGSRAASFPLLSHVAGKLALILPQVAAVANVLAKLAPIAAQLGAVLLDLVGPSGLPVAAELPPVPGQRTPVLPDVGLLHIGI